MRIAALALFVVCTAMSQHEQPTVERLFERKLEQRLTAIEEQISGVLGCAAIDLTTGRILARNGDTLFPQASSIKIPVMMQVFEQVKAGKLRLDQPVTLAPAESVSGSGHLRLLLRSGKPLTHTVEDLVTAMIETSDNTATNKVIAIVGMAPVNAMLDRLGFKRTRLQRIMLDGKAAARGEENISTPLEMARLTELIYRGKAVDEASSRKMLAIMKLVNADFRASVPPEIIVAAKPGELTGVRCETGLILLPERPFVLSVASTFLQEPENPVPAVARAVYQHFSTLSRSNAYGNGGVR